MSIISSPIAQKIIHSQLVSLLGFIALNYLLLGWISTTLCYISIFVLCSSFVAFYSAKHVLVWVRHQSSPEHIQSILENGFNAPHNEAILINQFDEDKNALGQRGLDRISFSGPYFAKCWEAMLASQHGELETLWVKVPVAEMLVSRAEQRYALSFLNKSFGTGVEYTAERETVNVMLATAVVGKEPPQKLRTYVTHALLVVGALWSERFSFVQSIQAAINACRIAYHATRSNAIARKQHQNDL